MKQKSPSKTSIIHSPLGPLTVELRGKAVVGLAFGKRGKGVKLSDNVMRKLDKELKEYFTGKRTRFTFDFRPEGTQFQKSVWQLMQRIPYGKTMSYAEIAKRIGRPKAVRAVGSACGKNPIVICVPCHRVVGARGLGGYSGGLHRKKHLLKLENR